MPSLAENAKELKTLLAVDSDFWIKQGDNDLTDDQKKEVKERGEKIEELSSKIEESKQYQAAKAKYQKLADDLNQPVDRPDFGNPEKKTKIKTQEASGVSSSSQPSGRTGFTQSLPLAPFLME